MSAVPSPFVPPPTLAGLVQALAAGALSSAGATEWVLARAERLNPAWRAFSFLDGAGARAAAAAADARRAAGRRLGPLDGVPVTVKGNIPVAGWPWTEGSALYQDRVAAVDAAIVSHLRAAGAVLLGATTLSELAMYAPDNAAEPMGLNPWDPDRTAGGSTTGGGVAAALGLGWLHLGTDSGGSVRNPGIHCGAAAFKPARAALDLGSLPIYAPSLDALGLIARDVAGLAVAFSVLAGAPPPAPLARPPRLLVPQALVAALADEPTLDLFAAALARLGAAGCALVEAPLPGWTGAELAAGTISLAEGGVALATLDLTRLGPRLVARAAAARALDPSAVAAARSEAAAFACTLAAALDAAGADAVLTPGWPFAAPPVETETVAIRGAQVPLDPRRNAFVRLANAVDAPALALPAGLYPGAGVPWALHLTGRPGDRRGALLAVAAAAVLPAPPLPPAATDA